MHTYFLERMARERVAELHAIAARAALLREAPRPPRRSPRRLFGATLVRLGRWILGEVPPGWADQAGRLP